MYRHITSTERDQIAIWLGQEHSIRWIARHLHRSHASIIREVRRNHSFVSGQYVAIAAQRRSEERCAHSRRRHPLKNPDVYAYVFEKLRESWSPELITGRLKDVEHPHDPHWHLHWETIYRFIYQGQNRDKRLWEYLPRHQTRRRQQNGRSVYKARIPQRVSIHQRPEIVNTRQEFGHWEGDTIEGRKSEGDGIHTEVERLSRFLSARLVDRIASPETIRIQLRMFRGYPETARRSTTLDNGREHHRHLALRFLKMQTFFCDPYSSWQRGTNENTNGLLRRYLPKGTSFRTLDQEELDEMVWEINHRPKKCLGYHTPREVFEGQLSGALPE